METSYFVCMECGMVIPLPRKHGKRRERGHIKDIYCPGCKKETKFRERRNGDYEIAGDSVYY